MTELKFILEHRRALIIFVLISILLTLSAFTLEYGFDAKPCQLCWYQRYYHWALGAIALLGLAFKDKFRPRFTLMLLALVSLIGFGTAVYHTFVQLGVFEAGCSAKALMATSMADFQAALSSGFEAEPSCSDKGFTIFGLSLANWNIAVMLGTLVYALMAFWYRNDMVNEKKD